MSAIKSEVELEKPKAEDAKEQSKEQVVNDEAAIDIENEGEEHPVKEHEHKPDKQFLATMFIFVVTIFIFYASVVDYTSSVTLEGTGTVSKYYAMYQDVHIMIFIGFAFLMTFLRKHAFNSLGMTFLIGTMSIMLTLMIACIFHNWYEGHEVKLTLSIPSLIAGDFAAGAVLISYGAVLGRVTPTQILWMLFFELLFYNLNETIGVVTYKAVDMGGSMFVHTFGAYFGLAFSWAIGTPKKNEEDESSVYHSDMFAMIGTIFLWCFWPSFNGALAAEHTFQQERVVINTVLALSCSCIAAFWFSHLLTGKFDMVHIQNASLAGGVAIGSSSDLVVGPYASILVGLVGGSLSVIGYVYLTPKLNAMGVYDVCGVHNLHGMPGVLGGIAGAISAGAASSKKYGANITQVFAARATRTASEQAGMQAACLGTTLLLSIFGGIFSGYVVLMIAPKEKENLYSDQDEWEVPEKEFIGSFFQAEENEEETEQLIVKDHGVRV